MTVENSITFEAIGTYWSIIIEDQISKRSFNEMISTIKTRITRFDHTYSRFKSTSLVREMSQKAGNYLLPEDAQPLMDLYQRLYDITSGQLTPLIGTMLEDAGYDANYSLTPRKIRSIPEWSDALEYSYPILKVKVPVLLDIGAIGKGYIVDLVSGIIKQQGFSHFSINAGGDILNSHASYDFTEIILEHPIDTSLAIGTVNVNNKSICASSGNRRAWADFHHIINPYTKTSPKHILASWVIADTTIEADGLSTALYFSKPEELMSYFDFEYMLIDDELSIKQSHGFPAKLFAEL